MNKLLTINFLFSFIFFNVWITNANMCSPWLDGDSNSRPYSSRNIDIIHEKIEAKAINIQKMEFHIFYLVRSDSSCKQIPLIFDTQTRPNYYQKTDSSYFFRVWVDGNEIEVKEFPYIQQNTENTWTDSIIKVFPGVEDIGLSELKYFEIDLSKGEHVIEVKYIAKPSIYLGEPVRQFEFSYNLEPARYWRSFAGLDLTVDVSGIDADYSLIFQSNSNESMKDTVIKIDSIWKQTFNSIPQNKFIITVNPHVSPIILFFTDVTIFVILCSLTFLLHVLCIIRYGKKYPSKKYPMSVIGGSLLVGFIFCLDYMASLTIMDMLIGDMASGRHGYAFLIIFMYPLIVLIYMPICWIIDLIVKGILANS